MLVVASRRPTAAPASCRCRGVGGLAEQRKRALAAEVPAALPPVAARPSPGAAAFAFRLETPSPPRLCIERPSLSRLCVPRAPTHLLALANQRVGVIKRAVASHPVCVLVPLRAGGGAWLRGQSIQQHGERGGRASARGASASLEGGIRAYAAWTISALLLRRRSLACIGRSPVPTRSRAWIRGCGGGGMVASARRSARVGAFA